MDIQIYLAGTYTFGIAPGQKQYLKLTDKERGIADHIPNRLESYHYVGKQQKVNEIRASGEKVFLDSGAFSAKSLGIEISVEEYCDYIQKNHDIVRVEDGIPLVSVLDSIGDPLLTWQNQKRMEDLGVRPLPCFHQGEDERYLEYYVANYDYITIGGIVGGNPTQLKIWLDRIFDRHILDGAGNPKTRVHGFGMTSEYLMERYPWYSCDSSSWVQTTAFGGITVPGYGNIAISEESPSRHDFGKHVDNLTPIERERLEAILSRQGFVLDEIRSYLGRMTYNMWTYVELERLINEAKKTKGYEPFPMELF